MKHHISIEDRLEMYAEHGYTKGFTLKIWNPKANYLRLQGVSLRNPIPTDRRGEYQYEVDFSAPLPGTLSERLYKIAMEVNPDQIVTARPSGPFPIPYNIDWFLIQRPPLFGGLLPYTFVYILFSK